MRHYTMVFNTTTGSRRSMRINNPNTDLPVADIQAAIGQMIQYDVFDQERGGLDSLNRMELTVVERTLVI